MLLAACSPVSGALRAPTAARRPASTISVGVKGFATLPRPMSSGAARRRSAQASPASHIVAAAQAADDVQGAMLDKPSAANKNWVRAAAVALVVAAASRGTSQLPAAGTAFVHLLAYGTWLGAIVWTTAIAGIVMFKNLPRQTFGRLQSKLFPIYFALSSVCAAVQLGIMVFASANAPRKQLILLGVGLATSLLSYAVVEPLATRIMFQRYDLENAPTRDEAAISKLAKQFGKWHGISSLLNLATLVTAVGHGWWLASNLVGILA